MNWITVAWPMVAVVRHAGVARAARGHRSAPARGPSAVFTERFRNGPPFPGWNWRSCGWTPWLTSKHIRWRDLRSGRRCAKPMECVRISGGLGFDRVRGGCLGKVVAPRWARRAVVVGGSVTLFFLLGGVHTGLVETGFVRTPYLISWACLCVLVAMGHSPLRTRMRCSPFSQRCYLLVG